MLQINNNNREEYNNLETDKDEHVKENKNKDNN